MLLMAAQGRAALCCTNAGWGCVLLPGLIPPSPSPFPRVPCGTAVTDGDAVCVPFVLFAHSADTEGRGWLLFPVLNHLQLRKCLLPRHSDAVRVPQHPP